MFGEHRFNREVRVEFYTNERNRQNTNIEGESGGERIYSVNRSGWVGSSGKVDKSSKTSPKKEKYIHWNPGTQVCAHRDQFLRQKLDQKNQAALWCPLQSLETSPTLSGDEIVMHCLGLFFHSKESIFNLFWHTRRARSWLFPVYVSQGGVSS